MRRRALTLVLALAAAITLASPAAAKRADLEASLGALRHAAKQHPDDPDYSWAVAVALEAAGRPLQAAALMRKHLTRWPESPRGGWRALGRCEYRAGNFAPAREALAEAVRRDERDAEAQLYLGLALQAQGEGDASERHLEAAAALDAKLAGDALLLAGVSHMARGDVERGRALLERVIELAPESDPARHARAALAGSRRPAASSPFELTAYTGMRYDSNVTLEGEGDLPGAGADDDAVVDFGSRFAWHPPLRGGEERPLELSASYERFDYLELEEFSGQRATGGAAWIEQPHPNLAFRLYGAGSFYALDNEPYLLSGVVQPTFFVALGGRAGVLRLHGVGEYLDYDEDPLTDALVRSGWEYGGGAEHVLPFDGERAKGFFAWGGSYSRRDTEASRDLLGYRSAYDSDRWRATTRAQLELPWEIRARGDLYFDAERFDHHNVIDSLSEASTTSADKRYDHSIGSSVSLRRPLFGGVDLELLASFEDHDSNIDLYAYRRATAGMRLHAAFD